ncbi:MAG: type II toxin-antitoxin system VapC family toxin [Phreatobacter sp.]|jgi:ribonuclease VapC|uniref:type II toxin-antitoxin system VapC family toxin n=1 Tax=Phreatobacter sp. TaxID=1966341 RepID=UPI0040365F4D
MVIDTSALLAILLSEPDGEALLRAIAADGTRLMSAGSVLEAGIIAQARKGDAGSHALDLMITKLGIEVVAMTPRHADIARRAFRLFGKGQARAGLNYGDCIAYALARDTGEPLLFKGDDFSRTDVVAAPW